MSFVWPRNDDETPRHAARIPATNSQPRSNNPGRPSSAATVTGVSCEAAFFGSFPLR